MDQIIGNLRNEDDIVINVHTIDEKEIERPYKINELSVVNSSQ